MIAQVAPMLSTSDFDYRKYQEMGWTAFCIMILIGIVILAVLRGKISIVSIGPSEAGIRELFGVRLWRIGPGPHLNIEGFWKARKASIAVIEVDLVGEYPLEGYTKQYSASVWLRVQDTKEALIAHMYRAQDLNRDNMENSEAVKQATTMLKRNLRVILEEGEGATVAEQQLEYITHKELLGKYGYEIDQVLVTELADRPLSELARAVATSNNTMGAVLGVTTPGHPHLEAVSGGAGNG